MFAYFSVKMDTEDPSLLVYTELQSFATQEFPPYKEASMACKNETYAEDIFVPGSSNGKNLRKRYPSPPMSIMIAEVLSVKNTARRRVQAPEVYSSNRGQESATGDVSALSPTVSLQHGVAMESSSSPPHSSQKRPEEAARKRELRMKKNREAAREFRRKKKEWIRYLENRVAVLENQNKNLLEELTALKDLYCQKTE
ncbi:cAMP-responsive element modulator-like isoform 2-T2 [Clarias gariepinus]